MKKYGTVDTRIIKNEENKKSYKDLLLAVVLIGKPYSYKNTSDSISCIFNRCIGHFCMSYEMFHIKLCIFTIFFILDNFNLADFFEAIGDTSFLSIDTDDLKTIFKEYCKEKELSGSLSRIIIPCQHAILEFRDKLLLYSFFILLLFSYSSLL